MFSLVTRFFRFLWGAVPHCVASPAWNSQDSPAFAAQVLGLKTRTTTLGKVPLLKNQIKFNARKVIHANFLPKCAELCLSVLNSVLGQALG